MMSEEVISFLIFCHAALGGLALIAGFIAIVAQKGLKVHKVSGKTFFISMVISAILSLLIATQPNHKSPFLLAIGIFTLYFIIAGARALRFKRSQTNLSVDKFLSTVMMLTGLSMIILPIVINGRINIVLAAFGAIGTVFALRDLSLYRQTSTLKKVWLKQHLGKMLGGYISTVTAFIVVNQVIPGIFGWFAPSVLGSFYIAFWIRKLNTSNKRSK